jgi:hypothetical protein
MSVDDEFLARLACGKLVSQDEYDQLAQDLPGETIAAALAQRFNHTNETRILIEAAKIYIQAGLYLHALEVCSRAQRFSEVQKLIARALPEVRRDYPNVDLIGKLMDEAMLVIDLRNGKITRFPPIMPATSLENGE